MTFRAPDRAAVFLDRDGTLIDDPGYLGDPAQVRLLPGAGDALRELADAGFRRIVVTNQSAIGRGMITAQVYRATESALELRLAEVGASVDQVLFCPHMPDDGCPCRKPAAALHRQAIAMWDLDPTCCWFIGDHLRDLQPALELGGRMILVRTGQGQKHLATAEAIGAELADDLPSSVALIRRYLGPR